MDLLGFENYDDLKDAHYKWVDSAMQTDNSVLDKERENDFDISRINRFKYF
jgi:hypothetical protein